MKQPWCKFYPRDWLGDIDLRSVSYGARGLWADMLCLMASNEDRPGYLPLTASDKARDKGLVPELARLTAGNPRETVMFLRELEAKNVFSRDEKGVIFCRRLVRDFKLSRIGRETGQRGGNPKLMAKPKDSPAVETRHQQSSKPLMEGVNGVPYRQPLNPPLCPESRSQKEEGKKPLGKCEQIAAEKQLEQINAEISALEDQTHYEWDRTPSRIANLSQLREKKEALATKLREGLLP